MNHLSETEVQVNRTKYQSMIGKQVTLITTGKEVKGVVTAFKEDNWSFNLVVEHEAVNWGGYYYNKSEPFARKVDNFGSLNNLKIIE